MRFFKAFFAATMLLAMPMLLTGAEVVDEAHVVGAVHADAGHGVEGDHGHGEHESHGLPLYAPTFDFGFFKVNNSMIVTWIVALLIIWFARSATANLKEVPEGKQNFWEWLVEGLYDFLEGIIGHELVKKTYWFFATIFIMILACNWFGLMPGVGSIGWSVDHHHITRPLFRGSNADLNMTFAMAMIFFVCWTVWAIQSNGIGGFILHIFGPKGETAGLMKVMMVVVFFVVGLLEVVSIVFRPVSLSFRLFGNIFAGENVLETMLNMSYGYVIALPFYAMELLVGVVQALVFMLLTAVFTLLICTHDEEHAEGHH